MSPFLASPSIATDARCVFVLSTGRTGTRTLSLLLELCPQVAAFHEPRPKLIELSFAAMRDVWQRRGDYGQQFWEAKAQAITEADRDGRIYAETSNRFTYLAPALADVLPRAKFIHLHRHPAEVVRSGMRRGWYVNHPGDRHRLRPAPEDLFHKQWNDLDAFSKCCWYWHAVNQVAIRFVEALAPQRSFQLRFDHLISPDAADRLPLWDFLEVDAPSSSAVEATIQQRANRQRFGHFPPVADWSPQQWAVLHGIAGTTMDALGY